MIINGINKFNKISVSKIENKTSNPIEEKINKTEQPPLAKVSGALLSAYNGVIAFKSTPNELEGSSKNDCLKKRQIESNSLIKFLFFSNEKKQKTIIDEIKMLIDKEKKYKTAIKIKGALPKTILDGIVSQDIKAENFKECCNNCNEIDKDKDNKIKNRTIRTLTESNIKTIEKTFEEIREIENNNSSPQVKQIFDYLSPELKKEIKEEKILRKI